MFFQDISSLPALDCTTYFHPQVWPATTYNFIICLFSFFVDPLPFTQNYILRCCSFLSTYATHLWQKLCLQTNSFSFSNVLQQYYLLLEWHFWSIIFSCCHWKMLLLNELRKETCGQLSFLKEHDFGHVTIIIISLFYWTVYS